MAGSGFLWFGSFGFINFIYTYMTKMVDFKPVVATPKNTVVATELGKIYEREGTLTPTTVLEEAREETHPLHSFFTWDNTAAAESYRLIQAQYLIRSVKITIVEETKKITFRKYVNIRTEDEDSDSYSPWGKFSKFVDVKDAVADDDMHKVLFESALSELRSFRRKYSALKELAVVFTEVDKILDVTDEENDEEKVS